jgi:Protein of unknown function (DUF2778)
MWTYVQKTGELLRDGNHRAFGYSGYNDPANGQLGKNNPALQNMHDVGPIPVGQYDIGSPTDTVTHGPFVLPLTPHPTNQMFGRSGFLIHGDSVVEPGTASRGCIIMSRQVRNDIAASGDTLLQVLSGIQSASQSPPTQ